MMDVFTLAQSGFLEQAGDDGGFPHVVFCEMDFETFPEILDVLGYEGNGFLGRLEDLALFGDNTDTQIVTTVEEIDLYLERRGESVLPTVRDRLDLKRRSLYFRDSFPYDLINLDFCDAYYKHPPLPLMRLNDVVKRIVEMQNHPLAIPGLQPQQILKFGLIVTSRFDGRLVQAAYDRLRILLETNRARIPAFDEIVRDDVIRSDPQRWMREDRDGFFLSLWPKEILLIGRGKGWTVALRGYVYYERVTRRGSYNIATVFLEFTRGPDSYAAESVRLLDPGTKRRLEPIAPGSAAGVALANSLRSVWDLRNRRARRVHRPELPEP